MKLPKLNMKWFLYGGIALMLFGAWLYYFPRSETQDLLRFHSHKTFQAVVDLVEKGEVKAITFLRNKDGKPVKVMTEGGKYSYWADIPGDEDYVILTRVAKEKGVAKDAKPLTPEQEMQGPADGGAGWASVIANIVGTLIIAGIVMFMFRKSPMGQGDKDKVTLTRLDTLPDKVTFADVKGIDDELNRIRKIVQHIQHPYLLNKLGGKLPVGGMLKGKPGTGKTYLVRAIAGELGIAVLACAGSSFVEMYVGRGAARVRDAFGQARRLRDELNQWVILFIDEFDAVGIRRSGSENGQEQRQTLNELLQQLNGAGVDNSRILVLVATNQPELLDDAVIRSERLGDLIIEVSEPDLQGRIEILQAKLRKVSAAPDIDVKRLASQMAGYVGADIATLVEKHAPEIASERLLRTLPPGTVANEGTFKPEDIVIKQEDLDKALEHMLVGNLGETKGRRLDDQIKHLLAIHELGHLVVAYRKWLQNTSKWDGQYGWEVSSISILGNGNMGGFVRNTPPHNFHTAKVLKGRLAIAMGGHMAELLFLNEVTIGAQNDLQQANEQIKTMILQLNMSRLNNAGLELPALSVQTVGGSGQYLGGQRSHAPQYGMSDFSASQVDWFIGLMLAEAKEEARAYLLQEQDFIRWAVPYVVTAERMTGPQIKKLWDDFHGTKDLSKAIAFPYKWDPNHQGLPLVDVPMPPMPITGPAPAVESIKSRGILTKFLG